jgi:hypothetical protein
MESGRDHVFRMDRTVMKQFADFSQSDAIKNSEKPLAPEEGLLAVEFLRYQFLNEGESFPPMDRKYFEYR